MKRNLFIIMMLAIILAISASAADSYASDNQCKYIAYYFHSTQRCPTCRKIEAFSREAIQNSFADELKNGTLVFQAINVEEPQNRHYIQDFKLYTKSLVITKVAGDKTGDKTERFRNLPKVWELVYSQADFTKYVKTEISSFMVGK
jgi:hypothetical protein